MFVSFNLPLSEMYLDCSQQKQEQFVEKHKQKNITTIFSYIRLHQIAIS